MEIPYTVTARPDTGLWNAKIGIWLFLASEVMLFGGLFSSYIFLRVGADYPWPVGIQKVPLGFTNTLVLILSSVTVVFAWASLKMRKYGHYQIYMAITLLCACGFMVIKFFEYKGKLTHWSVRTHDGSVVTGHIGNDDDDNYVFGDVTRIQLNPEKCDPSYFLGFAKGPGEGEAAPVFTVDNTGLELELTKDNVRSYLEATGYDLSLVTVPSKADLAAEGKSLVVLALVDPIEGAEAGNTGKELHARVFDSKGKMVIDKPEIELKKGGDTDALRELVAEGQPVGELSQYEKESAIRNLANLSGYIQSPFYVTSSVPITFSMSRRVPTNYTLEEGSDNASVLFRDGTSAAGKLLNNSVTLEVDAVDLQALNLKKVKDGDIKHAKAFDYLGDAIYEKFIEHRDKVHAEFLEKKGKDHPIHEDVEVRRKALQLPLTPELSKLIHPREPVEDPESEAGGEKGEGDGHGDGEHAHVSVEFYDKDIKFYSNFSPRLNTYYAIYFLLTGLHGLHVLGGIIVLGYFLFFGRKLYNKDPEHMANRVEVGGLFWHFVDLVWIFLFPILYLM